MTSSNCNSLAIATVQRTANPCAAPRILADYDDSFSALVEGQTKGSFFDDSLARLRALGGGVAPCLDYSAQSHTYVPNVLNVKSESKVINRCAIYPSGELAISTCLVNSNSRPPKPSLGRRMTTGLSRRGARKIKRAVIAYSKSKKLRWIFITLTTQKVRSDAEMKQYFDRFLMWGRKYLPKQFEFYVWSKELQARGVIHYHLILPYDVQDKGLFKRMRELWSVKYDMGAGSFDIKRLRHGAKSAASYVGKMANYLDKDIAARPITTKVPSVNSLGRSHNIKQEVINIYASDGSLLGSRSQNVLDADGNPILEPVLVEIPWRVSADGVIYERIEFEGRAYGMSKLALSLAVPLIVHHAPWGTLPCIGLRGDVRFYASVEDAQIGLSMALYYNDRPPPNQDGVDTFRLLA